MDQLWILERIPDCACLDVQNLGPKRNLDHRSFFRLGRYVNGFIQKITFSNEAHLNSGVRLLVELYYVIVIKHVVFFTICAKLTMAFTFTSLPLNFYSSVSGCRCSFGFEQNILADRRIWRKKRHGSADLHTPIHSPPGNGTLINFRCNVSFSNQICSFFFIFSLAA